MAQYSVDQLVFIDETAKDERTLYRKHGYGRKGIRVMFTAPFIRGRRYSILPALTVGGYLTVMVVEGGVCKEQFMEFIERWLLPEMNPFPGPKSVIVADNCAIHKDRAIVQMVERAGCRIEYLPPYSPDYNPIEESFACLKKAMERAVWLRNSATPISDLHRLCDETITPEKTMGWLGSSIYVAGDWSGIDAGGDYNV